MTLAAPPSLSPSPAISAPPGITVPWTAAPPSMDAGADEPVWATAALVKELPLSLNPPKLGLAAVPTEVRLLWDADRLYIRFVCHGGDAFAPYGDTWGASHFQGDVVELFLDPVGDARQFFELEVSPKNGIYSKLYLATATAVSTPDGVLAKDFLQRDEWEIPDWRIDGLKTAASIVAPDSWIVDISLPAPAILRRLGQKQFQSGNTLRANFIRYERPISPNAPATTSPNPTDGRGFIAMSWTAVPWGRPHRAPAAMGVLTLGAVP